MARSLRIITIALAALVAAAGAARTTAIDGRASRSLRITSANASHTAPLSEREQFPANYDGSTMHIVFSVSCNQPHRLLLTTVLQDSAMRVGQKGPITQIVSGCSEDEQNKILREPQFYYDYRVHFTPSYSPHPMPKIDDDYTPYNKPFGLRHYLQNANPPVQHDVLALVDSDFVFFKPLEVNTGRNMAKYYKGSRDPHTVTDEVRDGVALAQDWTVYMGSGWFSKDTGKIVCADQPCANVNADDGREYYAGTGPPYIMTRRDMFAMVDDYCTFVVLGRQLVHDDWMTEMYAYAVAVANHGIKHTILTHLGVTHPNMSDSEYWSFLGDSSDDAAAKTLANPCADPYELAIPTEPPVGVHFCQSYRLRKSGLYFFKHALPLEVVGCGAMILAVPPASEFADIDVVLQDTDATVRVYKRHEVWAECTLTKAVNRALLRLKRATCPAGEVNTYQGLVLSVED